MDTGGGVVSYGRAARIWLVAAGQRPAGCRVGHIPGALSVPVEKLATMLRTLPQDREIVAYCRGPFCLFSHEAVLKLKKKGFEARRLKLGLPDWRFAGLPVQTGTLYRSPID